jgi:glutamate---cysteine ligase / carboxylate-amine ligase
MTMEHAFGASEPFTLGVEEELLLVEPGAGHRLAHVAERVLPALDLPPGTAGYEAYAAELELRSPIGGTVGDGLDALARARAAARAAGATLLGAGVHPAGELGDARLVAKERYRRVEDDMRDLIRRTPECALHVHVGMPDPETAIRACNGLRVHLPLLAALAANSPFWFGRDSGMASARAALVRAYPGRGVPRSFRDFADYEHAVEAGVRAGGADDYTHLWWDVRPHPRLGTVEVREMDAQSGLRDVAALAGLVHCLARYEADRALPLDVPGEAIAWSAFRAARDGLDAQVLDEAGDVRPVPEVARGTLARLAGLASELDAFGALEEVERILADGNGAVRQRGAHARGGMPALLDELVARTADPA